MVPLPQTDETSSFLVNVNSCFLLRVGFDIISLEEWDKEFTYSFHLLMFYQFHLVSFIRTLLPPPHPIHMHTFAFLTVEI